MVFLVCYHSVADIQPGTWISTLIRLPELPQMLAWYPRSHSVQILRIVFEFLNFAFPSAHRFLFFFNYNTTVIMGIPIEVAVLTAASLSICARLIGASFSTVLIVLISSSAVQLALFLAYHSLIHRWFVVPTKVLPYPRACLFFFLNLNPNYLLANWLSLEHVFDFGQFAILPH